MLPRSNNLPATTSDSRPPLTRLAKLNVLLVEDSDSVRQFARAVLEELHAVVTEANSGEEASRLLDGHHFDLIFSDVVMPGISGLDFARSVRDQLPNQRILLATGYSKQVAMGEAAGFQIVQKPYGAESLTAAISRTLSSSP
jgi:CheY-like chemotaxis protein